MHRRRDPAGVDRIAGHRSQGSAGSRPPGRRGGLRRGRAALERSGAQGGGLEARTTVNARSGAELFQSQQIGLDCLDRFSAEREALHASLEIAVADPAAYGDSLREAREHGTARLHQDLARLRERSRALSAHWKVRPRRMPAPARDARAEMDGLKRRNTAALESDPPRALADPALRAAEALVATTEAWDRERATRSRLAAARDEAERRRWPGSATRRDDWRATTGRARNGCWAGEVRRGRLRRREQLPQHLAELLELERLGDHRRLGVGEKCPVARSLVLAGDEHEQRRRRPA